MKWLLLLLASVLCCLQASAQQLQKHYADYSASSGFVLDSLDARDPQVLDNLETLARVWGYAKYHHPVFCDSTLNVDYELFELLPKVAHTDKQTRNRVLFDWVKGLGGYKPNKSMYDEGMSSVQHWSTLDLGWMADTTQLGSNLSAFLRDLRYAERDRNYYVQPAQLVEGIGWQPIVFNKESYHSSMVQYDCGYQLLTLFRFWNIVEYYAPNKLLTDKPWHTLLKEYIPQIALAQDFDCLKALMRLTSELCDGHTSIPNELYFGNHALPIRTMWLDNSLIVTNPGTITGLHRGDEIIGFDNRSIHERVDEMKRYIAASNEAGVQQNTLYYLTTTPKEECNLTFLRDGRCDSLRVKTTPIKEINFLDDSVKTRQGTYHFLQDSIGYIDGRSLTEKSAEEVMQKFRNTEAIIIDLRNYPQYFLPLLIGELLIEKPTEYIRFSYPTPELPGEFYFAPGGMNTLYRGMSQGIAPQENPDAYKGRIVVLVNELTQSMAETSVMALQAVPNTIVVGSQTAGANGDLVFIPLPGNLHTTYSSIGCYYPDGYNMQRKGVKIDVEVRPTVEEIRAGRDGVLERALEIISERARDSAVQR